MVFAYGLTPSSTVKTVYVKQAGAEKGFNLEKRGALSYYPLLAFCTYTKDSSGAIPQR